MSQGKRAEKKNRKMDHDWHMWRRSMSGKRVGNLPYEWNENNDKTITRRRERRKANTCVRP